MTITADAYAEDLYGTSYLINKGWQIVLADNVPDIKRLYVFYKTLLVISAMNSVKLVTSMVNIVSLVLAVINPSSEPVLAVSIVSLVFNVCVLLLTFRRRFDDGTTRVTQYRNKAYVSQHITMNHVINIVSAAVLLNSTLNLELILAILRLVHHCSVFTMELFNNPQLLFLNLRFMYIVVSSSLKVVFGAIILILYYLVLIWIDLVLSFLLFLCLLIGDIFMFITCQEKRYLVNYRPFPIWQRIQRCIDAAERESIDSVNNFGKTREFISERLRKDKMKYVDYLNQTLDLYPPQGLAGPTAAAAAVPSPTAPPDVLPVAESAVSPPSPPSSSPVGSPIHEVELGPVTSQV